MNFLKIKLRITKKFVSGYTFNCAHKNFLPSSKLTSSIYITKPSNHLTHEVPLTILVLGAFFFAQLKGTTMIWTFLFASAVSGGLMQLGAASTKVVVLSSALKFTVLLLLVSAGLYLWKKKA